MARRSHLLVLGLVVLAGCSERQRERTSDCEMFERFARGERADVPSDPKEFWTRFEECKVGGKSPCERAWVLLLSMPSMASPTAEQLAAQKVDYLRACEALPEQVQRCLTVWGLVHEKECDPLNAPEQLRNMERKQRGR